VLFPPTNGFREWISLCLDNGATSLVLGGCTLNSCVRVSAIETLEKFQDLNVIVDLNLCGARMNNYKASSEFNGHSAVASAVTQMLAAGVKVVRKINWRAHDKYLRYECVK